MDSFYKKTSKYPKKVLNWLQNGGLDLIDLETNEQLKPVSRIKHHRKKHSPYSVSRSSRQRSRKNSKKQSENDLDSLMNKLDLS